MANISGKIFADRSTSENIEDISSFQIIHTPHDVSRINDNSFSDIVVNINDAQIPVDTGTRLAADGKTILIPQPSNDPEDPLNWSSAKKHTILFIVGLGAFCSDFISSAGVPCIVLQGLEWNMTPNQVNYAGNLNVIMLAVGSLLWLPSIYFWGRAPTLLYSTILGTAFTIGSAVASDFETYYGMRALTGVTLTYCVATGLTFVKDMFFFHEHARKIGIWCAMFLLAPYLGACLGNFIVGGLQEWRPVMWMCVALDCLLLTMIVLFADETYYDHNLAVQPSRGTRWQRLMGIWQIRNHNYFWTFQAACFRLIKVLSKPIVPLIMVYYALAFMWSIGINITSSILFETPREQGGYGFSANAVGYTYLAPIVGVALGEAFGHWFNDFIATRYIHRHKGHFKADARLWTTYVGAFAMIPGLILVGQALHFQLSPAAIVVGWGMYVFGVMVSSVAITAYALDVYPIASGELCALINVARTGAGFATGYFQQLWGQAQGYDVSFGIQAATVGVAVVIIVVLHVYGDAMRIRAGTLII